MESKEIIKVNGHEVNVTTIPMPPIVKDYYEEKQEKRKKTPYTEEDKKRVNAIIAKINKMPYKHRRVFCSAYVDALAKDFHEDKCRYLYFSKTELDSQEASIDLKNRLVDSINTKRNYAASILSFILLDALIPISVIIIFINLLAKVIY